MPSYIKRKSSITMAKFVKIVCIGFCFVICNLRSAEYNVITVSRNPTYAGYDELKTEEIYLVFAQLARCLSDVNMSAMTCLRLPEKMNCTLVSGWI